MISRVSFLILVLFAFSFNTFAAKLQYSPKLTSLEDIAQSWEYLRNYTQEKKVNEHGELAAVRFKFSPKKNESYINIAKQAWYKYSRSNEYEADAKGLSYDKLAKKLYNISCTIYDAGEDEKYIYYPKKLYKAFYYIQNQAAEKGLSTYYIDQSDADGYQEGIVLVDGKNKEVLVLAADAHI